MSIMSSVSKIASLYVVQHPDNQVLLKRDLLIKPFESAQTASSIHLNITKYKDICFSSHETSGMLAIPDDNLHKLAFIRRNDLFFTALVLIGDSGYQFETLWVMECLKLLIEVIEEAIGLEKLKEQFYSVSLMLDLMFDYGLPLLSSKPLLVAFLQMPAPGMHSLLNKAAHLFSSTSTSSPASYGHIILQALKDQLNSGDGANSLWRWTNNNAQLLNGQTTTQSIAESLVKDVYIDIIEEVDGTYEKEKPVYIKVSGELVVETRLPTSSIPRLSMRLKVGNNHQIEDVIVDPRCGKGSNLIQQISESEYCPIAFTPPQAGKFKPLRYSLKKLQPNIPFDLKAKYGINSNGLINFEMKFERFSTGKSKEGQKIYPQFEGISIKLYLPEETKSASLTSMPEGTFSFDQNEKIGEWTLLNIDANSAENKYSLVGSIKLEDGFQGEIPSGIVAVVNMKMTNTVLSGTSVDKIICSLGGGSKDDQSIFRGVKTCTVIRNMEYRL